MQGRWRRADQKKSILDNLFERIKLWSHTFKWKINVVQRTQGYLEYKLGLMRHCSIFFQLSIWISNVQRSEIKGYGVNEKIVKTVIEYFEKHRYTFLVLLEN